MIGPRKMTREERMKIAHTIANQVLVKYGSNVKAIGIYGSLARKTDGPFSDIEIKCILNSLEEGYSYEWTSGDWKAEVNIDCVKDIIEEATTVEENWPLTHGQFFNISPIYDPDEFFQELRQKAGSVENRFFKEAICKTLVEEMYEYMGKLRNIEFQGPKTFLPTLAMEISTTGAMILGLHNKRCFTTSAQVLPEAMSFTDKPDGFDVLCKMVMSGDLSDSKQIINSCEKYWENLLNWSANHDYMIKCSIDLPVQSK
ncbi:ANT(4')-I family aminoglycoside nucleotidyltransferase [Bacillus toyonensis]|uniref:ANT(4')-I family aminoglycoside nucleotidyltransferase n=1 Tax=Bacillus toyonensis TaxID=155322 RepID=UPI002E2452D2|nr:ANT(4')-I family aminoglycoside nucleotidyltransferase [Bacillus toyonensis]MED2693767.1 ANT(4')-I family aminoglycoside nucleotidyltransferase [Bacillus toyonensis]